MGKAGRFACVFTPMALTIASLVCLILVALGGTNQNNGTYNSLYFFRANTSGINIDPSLINIPSNPVTNEIAGKVVGTVKTALDIKDFYHIHLWNYCSGDFESANNSTTTSSSSNSSETDDVTFCSPHTNEFWFNPVEVWGLNNTNIDKFFSKELQDGLNAYHTAAKWMFICYIIALISTIVEILVGFLALFSRLGSLVTTIVSSISSLFLVGFALTSTILYSVLSGTFNTALNKYNIQGNLGHSMYVVVWLAAVFSLLAGVFWLFSSCCCSGRSDRIKGYNDDAGEYGRGGGRGRGRGWGKGGDLNRSYTYERMGSPFQGGMDYNQNGNRHSGGQQHQMGYLAPQRGGQQQQQSGYAPAYEPFRHNA